MGYKKKGRLYVVEDHIDAWLMTYADMITLLLCFFIILLSVSEPKKEEFEKLKLGIMSKFSMLSVETPFESVYQTLQVMVENSPAAQRNISVEEKGASVVFELSSAMLFPPGSAELKTDALNMLAQFAESVKKADIKDYAIEVEGHTDDVPIRLPQYASNWELSAARAASVVRFLIAKGIPPAQLRAVGYADTHPKVSNLDALGSPIAANRELNRRVVIRLTRPDN